MTTTMILSWLGQSAAWVAQNSARAALVVVLILLLQRLGRSFMSARARSNLWLILVLHLVLPWAPNSVLSLYGWLPDLGAPAAQVMPDDPVSKLASPVHGGEVPGESAAAVTAAMPAALAQLAGWMRDHPFSAVWSLGVVVFGAAMLLRTASDYRTLSDTRLVRDRAVLDLLDECRSEAGIAGAVGLAECDHVPGPLVTGLWRPQVLLPGGLTRQLSIDELRHVFLHEMAHIRRRDLPLATLMGVLLVVHWFNPLIWFANHRLRIDRELACDAFVLRRSRRVSPMAYGHTVIHLLERCQRPAFFPSAAGILESRSEVKRRIKMIAQHQITPKWRALVSGAAASLLAVLVLSRPVEGQSASVVPQITTTVSADGRQVDSVDLPFVYDGRVVGTWESVDFVANPADFNPRARQQSRELYLKQLQFNADGTTNLAWTWTAGYVLSRANKLASRYEIFSRDGGVYLALEWKSGDYVFRHQAPKYYILRQVSAMPNPPQPRRADDIALPFVDDPAVVGVWRSVDVVRAPDEFTPGQKKWQGGDLYLKQMEFLPGGAMPQPWMRWTSGVVMHSGDRTASHYEIRDVGGAPHLFIEWKGGDYTLRGMQPRYYVLRRER